jgi:transposase
MGWRYRFSRRWGRDPHAGDLYVFRGARGDLLKIVWHDGIGMSLYAKRLERGRFIWPSPADGVVAISAAQLAYMLDGHRLAEPGFHLAARGRRLRPGGDRIRGCDLLTHPIVESGGALRDVAEPGACRCPDRFRPISSRRTR